MGQKSNPIGMRIGIVRTWDSIWWDKKNLGNWLVEDELIRRHIFKKFRRAEVARVKIERNPGVLKLIISTGKPAQLIGQKGNEIDALKTQILKIIADKGTSIDTKIEEVRKISTSAQILAVNLALQIERNMPYKRVMKKIIADALKDGIKGIKIKVSGRLGGAEMARSEWYAEGRIPTQTLRADIDYAIDTAQTKYGSIGIKVWLFKGEIIDKKLEYFTYTPRVQDKERKDNSKRKAVEKKPTLNKKRVAESGETKKSKEKTE
jgi:small subunit ribosomal protein S3